MWVADKECKSYFLILSSSGYCAWFWYSGRRLVHSNGGTLWGDCINWFSTHFTFQEIVSHHICLLGIPLYSILVSFSKWSIFIVFCFILWLPIDFFCTFFFYLHYFFLVSDWSQVLPSLQPIIVYFPDSAQWLLRAVPKSNRREFIHKVEEMFEQLHGPVVLICGQNIIETGSKEKEKYVRFTLFLSSTLKRFVVYSDILDICPSINLCNFQVDFVWSMECCRLWCFLSLVAWLGWYLLFFLFSCS